MIPILVLAFTLAATVSMRLVRADVQLVLIDGKTLDGVDVRRDQQVYLLTLENGRVAAVPVELVKEVRLEGPAKERAEESVEKRGPDGIVIEDAEDARTLAGEDEFQHPGVRYGTGQQLAGPDAVTIDTSEELAVFGEPAKFQEDIIDPDWVPESDWDDDPVKNNNFAPSTWSKGWNDPEWQPESAFDRNEDVLADSRSTWSDSVIDNEWRPTDGFKNGS